MGVIPRREADGVAHRARARAIEYQVRLGPQFVEMCAAASGISLAPCARVKI